MHPRISPVTPPELSIHFLCVGVSSRSSLSLAKVDPAHRTNVTAAAPPSSAMNFRRRIRYPSAGSIVYRGRGFISALEEKVSQSFLQRERQVLARNGRSARAGEC